MRLTKTLAIAVLLLVVGPSLRAQFSSSWKEEGLRGSVSTIRVEAVRTDADGLTGQRLPVYAEVFDAKGRVMHQEVFKPDGSLKWTYKWGHAYDDQGREVKTYYYNAKGTLTNTGVSVYDDKGRLTETTQINPNGSINHIRTYSYDDTGRKVNETHRNPNGTPRTAMIRTYDANGRLVEEVFLAADGSFRHKNTFTYDANGNQTESLLFKSDGTVQPWFRKSLKYDERGNVIQAVHYLSNNSVGSRETFSYEFDAHGNWIKRTTSREVFKAGPRQSESEVTYRMFTYF